MTYADFLKDCRKLAAEKLGLVELSRKKFAEICSNSSSDGKKKSYTEGHIRNKEEGYGPPGRELLEAAARAAGFDFEQCIRIPMKPTANEEDDDLLDTFRRALRDKRREAVIRAAHALAKAKTERRQKFGGRTRKK